MTGLSGLTPGFTENHFVVARVSVAPTKPKITTGNSLIRFEILPYMNLSPILDERNLEAKIFDKSFRFFSVTVFKNGFSVHLFTVIGGVDDGGPNHKAGEAWFHAVVNCSRFHFRPVL